ncbi:MAG: ABC transporter ATP-binding protein [Rhodospirillaceae bacterium]
MSNALLEAEGLVRRFGGVHAVDHVSFTLTKGERVALIGPNGAGKSTLFSLLGGQGRPDAGALYFAGGTITGLSPQQRLERGIARSFQTAAVFGSMTPREGLRTVLRKDPSQDPEQQLRSLFEECGLAHLADPAHRAPARDLAYGDVKRLELAMALASRPRLLLLDEPTAGCAPAERRAMMAAVDRAAAQSGLTVLFTEHDMDVVFGHAQRILVLDRGRLIADGTPQAVRADPQVKAIYLGG